MTSPLGSALAVFLLLSLSGCSATNMEGDLEDAESAVFFLTRHLPTDPNNHQADCLATLVAPNLLLTARHCLSETPALLVCGDAPLRLLQQEFYVRRVVGEDSWVHVAQVRVSPEGDDACGFDLAAVVLSRPIESSVRPIEVDFSAPYVGERLSQSTRKESGGLKTSTTVVACSGRECGARVHPGEFVSTGLACSGDSGGPLLDGDLRLSGVVSRSQQGCTQPVYSSLESHRDWLIDAAHEAATLGDYSPAEWTKP